jgi:hypothetical protein
LHRPASQVVRELMRECVEKQRQKREHTDVVARKVAVVRASMQAEYTGHIENKKKRLIIYLMLNQSALIASRWHSSATLSSPSGKFGAAFGLGLQDMTHKIQSDAQFGPAQHPPREIRTASTGACPTQNASLTTTLRSDARSRAAKADRCQGSGKAIHKWNPSGLVM